MDSCSKNKTLGYRNGSKLMNAKSDSKSHLNSHLDKELVRGKEHMVTLIYHL